jgi:hypothetical protein
MTKKTTMTGGELLGSLALDMMYGSNKKLTIIFSPKQSFKFTRKGKADLRANHGEAVFTWGRLNYAEKKIANKLKAKDFPYFMVKDAPKKKAA